jgi:hypothetical protein
MDDLKHRAGLWIVDGKEYPNIDPAVGRDLE